MCGTHQNVYQRWISNSSQCPLNIIEIGSSYHHGSAIGMSATSSFNKLQIDLDHVSGRRVQSQVNQAKLRKAEVKIATKMAKRMERTNQRVEYEASRLLESERQLQEEYKLYNPILGLHHYQGQEQGYQDRKLRHFICWSSYPY
ncbi:unnamed protein product [Absidia cylindrospora]